MASRLLLRHAQPALEAYPVTRRVADRRRDDYALLEPGVPGADAEATDGRDGDDPEDGDEDGDED